MSWPICVVDAFAAEPFRGNPAAVCLGDLAASDAWMQSVAAEMNLSETAFVTPRDDGGWGLRWFTPAVEVALCGHATLAAAHCLWESGRVPADEPIRFLTRSGGLLCRREGAEIWMDFPARPVRPVEAPAGLAEALGADLRWCGRSADDYLVELPHAAAVRHLQPDLALLARLPVRGVIVTAASDVAGFDFLSRFFAPAVGVPEDPVTGSAHCALGPFWAGRLGISSLRGWQASRRGGAVRVTLAGDRVWLAGGAVTVWRGELL